MENNPKKSKALIITIIFIILLLIVGYYFISNRAKIFNTKGATSISKIFSPLLGTSKTGTIKVINDNTNSITNKGRITGVVMTTANGNKIVQAEAGENLKKGDVLYIASFNKNNEPIVMKAISSDKNKSLVFGVASKDTNKGDQVDVLTQGILSGLVTNRQEGTLWATNNPLYLSDTIYGGLTKNPPTPPSLVVPVGSVLAVDPMNGSIRVGDLTKNTNLISNEINSLKKLNSSLLNNSSSDIRDFWDSIFGGGTADNNTVDTTDYNNTNNNGFALDSITIPNNNTDGNNNDFPSVIVTASPSILKSGEVSIINWTSRNATSCDAGVGNGTEVSGSFQTDPLTKNTSFTVTCKDDTGSASSTDVYITINDIGINNAPAITVTAKPSIIKLGETSIISWKAIRSVSCDAGVGNGTGVSGSFKTEKLTDNKSYTVVCTGIDGSKSSGNIIVYIGNEGTNAKCLNGADNPELCTTIAGKCLNKATNPPTCTTTGGNGGGTGGDSVNVCKNDAVNYPLCTINNKGGCIDGQINPPLCTIVKDGKGGTKCSNGADNPTKCNTIGGQCLNGAINPDLCNYIDGYKFPAIKLSADPIPVPYGEKTTISWTSINTTSCKTNDSKEVGTNGSFTTEALTTGKSFTVTCTGDLGSQSANIFIGVTGGPKDIMSVTVTADPTYIKSGGSSTIKWTSTNTTKCNTNAIYRGTGKTGSFSTGSLTESKSYAVMCTGANGSVSQDVKVNVTAEDINTNNNINTDMIPACSDGIDNDGDGLIDIKDPNCHTGGDINANYIATHDSESSSPPPSDSEVTNNRCELIDKNPLVFTEDEKARLEVLLRKFYLISSTLRTPESLSTLKNEIEQNQSFIGQISNLTKQCYLQTNDKEDYDAFCLKNRDLCSKDEFARQSNPLYDTSHMTRNGNPWFYKSNKGSFPYSKENGTGYLKLDLLKDSNNNCRNVSGYYYGTAVTPGSNPEIDYDCNTYNTFEGYGSCTKKTPTPPQNSEAFQRGCKWKDGVYFDETERILNIW